MSIASKAPTEVLGEIFLLLCTEPIALHELQNEKHFQHFPWAVGQVCRHWRWAFLSYPALWSALSLKLEDEYREAWPPTDPAYISEMNRRTALFLKRSRQQPLMVEVRVPGQISESVYMTIWTMLLSCSNRWKEVELDIKYESMIDGLVERRKEMSILESLTIVVCDSQQHKYGTAFEMAPCLTELSLEPYGGELERASRGTVGSWTFPWAQLTRLKIDLCQMDFTTCNAFRTFLLQFINVEELRISLSHFNIDSDADLPNCPPVRFPRLKSLTFSLTLSYLLAFFEAPLLEHLSVCDGCNDEDQGDHNKGIPSFVRRSSCRIRCLELEDCTFRTTLDIMGMLDHVEELYLSEVTEFRPAYAHSIAFRIADSSNRLLPKLRVLELRCCPGYFHSVIQATSLLFKARNTKLKPETTGFSTVPLERLSVTVDWSECSCNQCVSLEYSSKAMANALNYTYLLPSFAVISLENDRWERTLTVCASVTGALVDFVICYPENDHQYYVDESHKHRATLTG